MSELTCPTTARPGLASRLMRNPVVKILIGTVIVLLPAPLVTRLAHHLIDAAYRIGWPEMLAIALSFLAYRFFVHRIDKRAMVEFARPGAIRELGAGMALAMCMQVLLFGALALSNTYRFDGFNAPQIGLLAMVPLYIAVAMLEEMIGRGIIFGVTEQSLGSIPALIISALVFGAAHGLNEGATVMGVVNCTLFGALLAALYMLTRRLWVSIGFHFAWNYCESQVFSTAVSGHQDSPGLLQGHLAGADLLTGGSFGVEGSVVTFAIGVLATVFVFVKARQRGQVLPSAKRRVLAA